MIIADCHSMPLSLLLRGGYYTSFGKPHDGLGFVLPVMAHGHGSTGLAGVAIYEGDAFPAEFAGSVFLGNVVTSRVHRDTIKYNGSTMEVVEQPDLVRCDDPWFRPVDVRMGPDGALYIADFYNRIIGHYEVPLDHPQRDLHRGRIWRVVYTGRGSGGARNVSLDLASATPKQLIETLGSPSLMQRMLATDQLSDRIGLDAVPAVRAAISRPGSPQTRVHASWVLFRIGKLTDADIAALARDPDESVRLHAMRCIAESSTVDESVRQLAIAAVAEPSARVRRMAADALAQHPHADQLRLLLEALVSSDKRDVHLRHALRIALKQHPSQNEILAQVGAMALSETEQQELSLVAVAVPTPDSARLVLNALVERPSAFRDVGSKRLTLLLRHVAASAPTDALDRLIRMIRDQAGDDVDLQVELLILLDQQFAQRGRFIDQQVRAWGEELATDLLNNSRSADMRWRCLTRQNLWDLELRRATDGQESLFRSSLPGGEQASSVLQSPPFPLPDRLRFYVCGHRGSPENPATDDNRVQLRLVESGAILRTAFPPRNDMAQLVDWNFDENANQAAVLEIVDGMKASAFAWLAVARFDPPVLELPTLGPRTAASRQKTAALLIGTLGLDSMRDEMRDQLAHDGDWSVRHAAAEAFLQLKPKPAIAALTSLLDEGTVSEQLREQICQAVVDSSHLSTDQLVRLF
jgi:HEAT repeat protein